MGKCDGVMFANKHSTPSLHSQTLFAMGSGAEGGFDRREGMEK